MTEPRAQSIRRNRPRGIFIPSDEVSAHLACGWRVLDDCPGFDDVLLAPLQCGKGRRHNHGISRSA